MNELMTWQTMTTYGGAVLATATVTQFLKQLRVFAKLSTRLLSYLVALLVLLLVALFSGGLTWSSAVLSLINAAVVSLAANGAYDAVASTRECIACRNKAGNDGNRDSGTSA